MERKKQIKLFGILSCAMLLFSSGVFAGGSVILMIGDGMGWGHVVCKDGFLLSQNPSAWVATTHQAINGWIVDSPAAATAYSCGMATRNGYSGMTPDGNRCEHVAEKAVSKGYRAILATNDSPTGGTPTGFFAHSTDRYDEAGFRAQLATTPVMVIGSLCSPGNFTTALFGKNKGYLKGSPFFIMIEEAAIDWESHNNNLKATMARMGDFEKAVKAAIKFTESRPDVTLIVTGDHETGGLDAGTCTFASGDHTAAHVPLYAYGAKAHLFSGTMDNFEVGAKIREILFQ